MVRSHLPSAIARLPTHRLLKANAQAYSKSPQTNVGNSLEGIARIRRLEQITGKLSKLMKCWSSIKRMTPLPLASFATRRCQSMFNAKGTPSAMLQRLTSDRDV